MRGRFTPILIAALCGSLGGFAQGGGAQAYYDGPTLTLEGEAEADAGIPELADYARERLIEGIGWQIATTVRPDATGALPAVMSRSYTVILPARGDARPLRHMYVLAGFDLLPDCRLLVVIRDPQLYWTDYDVAQDRTDMLELVWYDRDWNEYMNQPLELGPRDGADDFRLSDKQLHLLAIRRSLREAGGDKLAAQGHSLCRVTLKDGRVENAPLPEADAETARGGDAADSASGLPQQWLPLLMRWDEKGRLVVQTGSGLRRYRVDW
jgi:hypothetical protein